MQREEVRGENFIAAATGAAVWDAYDIRPARRQSIQRFARSADFSPEETSQETSPSECSRQLFNTIVELHKSDSRVVA